MIEHVFFICLFLEKEEISQFLSESFVPGLPNELVSLFGAHGLQDSPDGFVRLAVGMVEPSDRTGSMGFDAKCLQP